MTPPTRKLIAIIIIAILFVSLACTTPGDAALQNYTQPETPPLLQRQATDIPFIGGD